MELVLIPNIFSEEKGFIYTASGLSLGVLSSLPDLSGNGNDLQQTVENKKPTVIERQGKKAIQFDGVDDFLSCPIIDLTGTSAFTFIVALRNHNSTTGIIVEHGASSLSGGFGVYSNNGSPELGGGMGVNSANYLFKNGGGNTQGRDAVLTMTFNPSSTTNKVDVRLDGVDVADNVMAFLGSPTNGVFGNRTLFIGARNGGSLFSNCEIYGIIGIARELTATELVDCETWAENLLPPPPPVVDKTRKYFSFENTTYTKSQMNYVETSPFAEVSFMTYAENIEIDTHSNIRTLFPDLAKVGVFVDGEFYENINHTENGDKTTLISLPIGFKKITIVNGAQSRPSTAILGTFFKAIRADAPLRTLETGKDKLVIYGDSISIGGNSSNPQTLGWGMIVRDSIDTAIEGWGYRCLADDNVIELADKIASLSPTKIWLAIGTNDYALNRLSAGAFGQKYGELLDELHGLCPDAEIYAQSPLLRSSEGANGFGNNTTAYRAQIETESNARPWVAFVDGTQIMTLSDLADGVHPNDTGHEKYAEFAIDEMGLSV